MKECGGIVKPKKTSNNWECRKGRWLQSAPGVQAVEKLACGKWKTTAKGAGGAGTGADAVLSRLVTWPRRVYGLRKVIERGGDRSETTAELHVGEKWQEREEKSERRRQIEGALRSKPAYN